MGSIELISMPVLVPVSVPVEKSNIKGEIVRFLGLSRRFFSFVENIS
jgi:hypothetical protein